MTFEKMRNMRKSYKNSRFRSKTAVIAWSEWLESNQPDLAPKANFVHLCCEKSLIMLYLLSLLLFLFTSNRGMFICFISGYGQKYGQKCRLPTAHFGQWGISFLSMSITECCFNNWYVTEPISGSLWFSLSFASWFLYLISSSAIKTEQRIKLWSCISSSL